MRLSFSIVSAFMISHFQFFIFNFQLFAPSCLRVFVRDISSILSFPVFNFQLDPFSFPQSRAPQIGHSRKAGSFYY